MIKAHLVKRDRMWWCMWRMNGQLRGYPVGIGFTAKDAYGDWCALMARIEAA